MNFFGRRHRVQDRKGSRLTRILVLNTPVVFFLILVSFAVSTFSAGCVLKPSAYIVSPDDSEQFESGEQIEFIGGARDASGSDIPDSSLSWSSDVDGYLGTGERITIVLTENEHTITLTAEDAWGRKGFASVRITVGSGSTSTTTVDYSRTTASGYAKMWPALRQPWYFNHPSGIAAAPDGSVYVADTENCRVFKFTASGELIDVWGAWGNESGQFRFPSDLAAGPDGSVYVVDSTNCCVQKFTADGEFVKWWGSEPGDDSPGGWLGPGIGGSDNGSLQSPSGIAAGPDGSVYVADTYNDRIQKFTADGEFITAWGRSGEENGQFYSPEGIAVTSDGLVYVADTGNDRVQKFNAAGKFLCSWGKSGEGQLSSPEGIAAGPGGTVYVADTWNDRIQRFTAQGAFLGSWGESGQGQGQFDWPENIATGPDGTLYVADSGNARIQTFSAQGRHYNTWESRGADNGTFQGPSGIAGGPDGLVYVADTGNDRIQKFTAAGKFLCSWGESGEAQGQFSSPEGIATGSDGTVYVADSGNARIQKFTADGEFLDVLGGPDTGQGTLSWPEDIAVALDGTMYVVDGHSIKVFSVRGKFRSEWKGEGEREYDLFSGIAVAPDGTVYVSEINDGCIQKFSDRGELLSRWCESGKGQGLFLWPGGVDVAPDGTVYVADTLNSRIQWFTPDGEFIAAVGTPGSFAGQFFEPDDVAVGCDGIFYGADTGNNRIQAFKPVDKDSSGAVPCKAIIVAGGGPYAGNVLWDETQVSANHAYRVLTHKLSFSGDAIYYLSANTGLNLDDDNNTKEVDDGITGDNLEYAVTEWAADAEDVFIYITDHGSDGTFEMSKSEIITAKELDSWLDDLQSQIPGTIIVVYDACESGSFVPYLTPEDESPRIVITSTAPGEEAHFVNQGSISFSSYFWSGIFSGASLYEAYTLARDGMELGKFRQTAQIDDNGNGIANEEQVDGKRARGYFLGGVNDVTASTPIPKINTVMADTTTTTETVTIWAENITTLDRIVRVWAHIISPDDGGGAADIPVTSLPEVELSDADEDGRYEGDCSLFADPGEYRVVFFARDSEGGISLPDAAVITRR